MRPSEPPPPPLSSLQAEEPVTLAQLKDAIDEKPSVEEVGCIVKAVMEAALVNYYADDRAWDEPTGLVS